VPVETATALVVRGSDWSETSRIVTLFSREHGKLRALAKGGRRVKSGFEIALDLLTVCRVAFIRKAHAGLDLLTEAVADERFPHLRQNLTALYAGYYIAELLADGTQDYDPHPELFDASLAALRRLGEVGVDPLAAASAFDLAWLNALGYGPRLTACAGCGIASPAATRAAYSVAAGGLVCPACGPHASDRRWLTSAGLTRLRGFAGGDWRLMDPGPRAEVRGVLSAAVSNVLGRRPRLLAYLEPAGSRAQEPPLP
jgi:DNA repair protein RecO (recombination protein O)